MKCSRCQEENPPQAKFCLGCAAPLAQACTRCGTQLSIQCQQLTNDPLAYLPVIVPILNLEVPGSG